MPDELRRQTAYLTHEVFSSHHSETAMLRYLRRLSARDYALDRGMIPLGSCTMKYNPRVNEAAARVEGLAWAHPYQPDELSQGAMEVMAALEQCLLEITGMDAVTLQPLALVDRKNTLP